MSSFDLLPDGGTQQGLDLAEVVAALDHLPTRLAVLAERALLARLEAGCAAPVGAHAVVEDDEIHLSAVVARLDGSRVLTHSARVALPSRGAGATSTSHDAADALARSLGTQVADALLAGGAAELAPLRATGPGGASTGSLWAPGTDAAGAVDEDLTVGGTDAPWSRRAADGGRLRDPQRGRDLPVTARPPVPLGKPRPTPPRRAAPSGRTPRPRPEKRRPLLTTRATPSGR
ncbi:hypothetical protein NKG05_14780 [Oerskovia sp. M15]